MSIPGHESPGLPGHCSLCFAYHTDERYRQLVDLGQVLDGEQEKLHRCRNLGKRLMAKEVDTLALDLRRLWHRCLAGMGNPRGIISPCLSCSTACKGYARLIDGNSADDD